MDFWLWLGPNEVGEKRIPESFSLAIEAVRDRPAILFHAEGHYTWVNSKALQVSGVTKQTADPDYRSD